MTTHPATEVDAPTSTVDTARLRLQHVTKAYGRTVAVDDVSLSVREGEFLTFLGQSGSGKTTILKLVAGFETYDSGTIEISGVDVGNLAPRHRNVAMVFQQYALFPHLSVADNIGYGLKRRKWPAAKRRARIEQMLELVRLDGLGHRSPRQLSGGQQQRVAVARALAPEPQLLLMDEPLGALDRALRLDLEHELRRIHRSTGCTVVYVTHDRDEALALSNRIAVFHAGQLVGVDAPEQLYKRPPTGYVARLLTDANLAPLPKTARVGTDTVTVDLDGRSVSVPSRTASSTDARIAIPRTAIELGATAAQDAPRFAASVDDVVFLGDYVKVELVHRDLGELIAHLPATSAVGLASGTTADFAIAADRCLVVT